MRHSFSLENTTRTKLPRADFERIKEGILGKTYKLSLVMIGPKEMKKLNLTYRGKRRATDILSFPLSDMEGEIYVCASEARKEARKFDRQYDDFLIFLFIHGCVHLKGYDHGGTMERLEASYRDKFGVS